MPDPAELAALHAACFTSPRPWTAAEIAGLLDSPHVFVLHESGGFLMGRVVAGEAEVLTIAVAPDQRRKGLGRRLMARFAQECSARAAERAFLEVAADNDAALALYADAGFRPESLRKSYYARPGGKAVDAVILSLALPDAGS
jgi:ribosomal-protein-alanine N-acetyltransferase